MPPDGPVAAEVFLYASFQVQLTLKGLEELSRGPPLHGGSAEVVVVAPVPSGVREVEGDVKGVQGAVIQEAVEQPEVLVDERLIKGPLIVRPETDVGALVDVPQS